MSTSPQLKEPTSITENKKQIHLNALLIALQYIDDLINSSQDGYVTLDVLQTHKLPKLENTYNINELRYHFQQLQMNKLYESFQTRQLLNYQKIVEIMSEIMKNEMYYQWFTVRVDEKVHEAYNYYSVIRFGMCFTFIAARLHVNLLSNIDLEMLGDNHEFSFIHIDASSYGGLQNEEQIVKKANIFIQRASVQEVDILGSTAYSLLKKKPSPYTSVQECLRDFLLISMNCKIYNDKQPDLCEIANQYSKQVVKLFEEKFEKQFSLPQIYNQHTSDLIELQKRFCINYDSE